MRQAAVGLLLLLFAAACRSSPGSSSLGPPTTASGSTQPEPCGIHLKDAGGEHAVLDAAGTLAATVEVSGQMASRPGCVVLQPLSSRITVDIGDKVEFVANTFPAADIGSPPEGTVMPYTRVGSALDGFEVRDAPRTTGTVVEVSTSSGPSISLGEDPASATPHVIVTLTAVHQGSVSIAWFDCSGTGC